MGVVRVSGWRTLACVVTALAIAPVMASDNSNSSLDQFELLDQTGAPISNSPLAPRTRPRPPPLQVLQAQLSADQALLLNEQQALYQAHLQYDFWLAQPLDPSGLSDPNAQQWQQTVASTQNTVNKIAAQIQSLTAQIAAAQ